MRNHAAIGFGLRPQVHEQRGIAAVVEDHVRAASIGPLEDAVGELPVLVQRSRPCARTRACRWPRSPRRRGPVSSRCCTTPSAPRRRGPSVSRSARRSGWSCAASRRCGHRAAVARGANSSRIAISPGISVSAMAISLRPQPARSRSATRKSENFLISVTAFMRHSLSDSEQRGRWRNWPRHPRASRGSTSAVAIGIPRAWQPPSGAAVATLLGSRIV